jgi:hypothetical protein
MPTPTPRKTSFPPDILGDTPSSDVNPYFRPSVKITDVITHQRIQQVLLPHLSIASFLALLGALDKRWRRSVSGEMVGRWVVREWGLTLGHGVAWPGLGVWEGFREFHYFLIPVHWLKLIPLVWDDQWNPFYIHPMRTLHTDNTFIPSSGTSPSLTH